MATTFTVDHEKLEQLIQKCIAETYGCCVETAATIGRVHGRDIKIVISRPESDERERLTRKLVCVREKK